MLALGACSSSSEDTGLAAPVDATVEGVAVKVLDAGAAPTEPLVWFSDSAGQESTFRITQGLGQHTEGVVADKDTADKDQSDDATTDLPYAEVTMELPLTTKTTTDGENLESTYTVGTPTGDNDDRNPDIATAEGFRMVQKYDDDGRVRSRTLAAPESATESARASVERGITAMTDLPLVFPTDPVGTGARWTVTGPVEDESAGISMTQTVTYTLTERKDSRVELGVRITRVPTVRQMAGTDLELLDSSSESTGSLTLDLRHPLPVSGSVKTTTKITYGQPESPVTVVQESRTTSTWTAAENTDD